MPSASRDQTESSDPPFGKRNNPQCPAGILKKFVSKLETTDVNTHCPCTTPDTVPFITLLNTQLTNRVASSLHGTHMGTGRPATHHGLARGFKWRKSECQ